MSSKVEPAMWSRDTGHIGTHGGVDGHVVTIHGSRHVGFHIVMLMCYAGGQTLKKKANCGKSAQ